MRLYIMMIIRNLCCFIPFLLFIILIAWTYKRTFEEVQKFHWNYHSLQPSIHSQRSLRNSTNNQADAIVPGGTPHEIRPNIRPTSELFKYIEPEIAGGGSYDEELRRYNLFMSSQGIICENIRHFGGMYMRYKRPPEFDPDGSWYLCLDPEVQLIPNKCVVYSVGINDEWSFDDSIAKYGCKVYAFDPTMRKGDHFRSPKIQFFKTGFSDVDSEGTAGASGKAAWKTRTLKTIIEELKHANRLIDVLKMDIEWDEWKCLPQMLADGTLRKFVKQFDVEFHVVDKTPYGIRRYYGISKWLDRQGFKIANMHKNMYCPQCYETTYVNTNIIKLPLR